MSLRISEKLYSIQGEGVHQRWPTVFLRLQGCNLKPGCKWCDTTYAQGVGGELVEIETLVAYVQKHLPDPLRGWVCITGGEPLFQQDDLLPLVERLLGWGYRVEIFTNGTIERPFWWELVDSWVVDIKGPSSGVKHELLQCWFDTRSEDQIKFVVADEVDLAFAEYYIKNNYYKPPTMLVSPMIAVKDGQALLEQKWNQRVWEFCLEQRVQFSLQLHKVVFGNKRGV